ncbi:SDR family NAD(P)-dependent oxidoreductase [Duganella phyllosphaerae]|uniref:Fatty acyl-CoA reductase n=1 Tax=Duganella phyllosphaerae TaxID=762836 RepID=A0A1E7X4G0_9BURK|nr:SDR family NAD(P)-dependent oxidoreductase [Duganella phyllosphaerae]OFA07395.1 fatty acyl-CoA reductase [Duganella phyllosphaerae]
MPIPLMVRPELLAADLHGKTYVITGANSGIGLVTAQQLARQGATVVMGVRRVQEGQRVAADMMRELPAAQLFVYRLDLDDLASVRSFAQEVIQHHPSLQGLVNNAGVMNTPFGRTRDGFETQFGVNHLGHFLLTNLLLDSLIAGAPSRVVNLSSYFHEFSMGRKGEIHFDDLNYHRRPFDSWEAYAQSKLANLLHARELARRVAGTGVTAVSVNPGFVRTNLMSIPVPMWLQRLLIIPVLRLAGLIEPWEGTQTSLHALLAPEVEQHSGAYYSQIARYRDKAARQGGWPLASPNPVAHDDIVAERLWTVSEALVAAKPPAQS